LGLKGSILFLEIAFFWGGGPQRSCDGVGRSAPFWRFGEPKKTGARSARARTRGQNPLVRNKMRPEKEKKERENCDHEQRSKKNTMSRLILND